EIALDRIERFTGPVFQGNLQFVKKRRIGRPEPRFRFFSQYETDRLWYRRTFGVPEEWAGKRILLHFGAVDWETTVWVNGKEATHHRGGYDSFSIDITDMLKASGPQEIIVSVWDPSDKGPQMRGKQVIIPHGFNYTGVSGIWQTVWIEPVAPSHIRSVYTEAD
ncbi:unnamed protein product, partial [marine sediment metagenome]